MKWIEVIHIRSTGRQPVKLWPTVQSLIDQVKCENIKIYSRSFLDTDLCLHLSHDSKEVEKEGSPLGLRLALAFKEFGLVNHNVWVEIPNS